MLFDVVFKGEEVDFPLSVYTFPSPALYQQPAQASDKGAALISPYYQEPDRCPDRASVRRSCTRGSCKRPVLAVMASLGAILMLICVCSFARRKKEHRHSAARNLSQNNRALSGRPDVCEQTYKEAETGAFEEEPRAAASPGGVEPPTKKRKTKEGESTGGEDTAGPSGAPPPSQGGRKATAKRKHLETEHVQPAPHSSSDGSDEAPQHSPYRQDTSGPTDQPFVTGEEGSVLVAAEPISTMLPAERTLAEVAAAEALLLLQQHPLVRGGLRLQKEEWDPQPSTSAAVLFASEPTSDGPQIQLQALAAIPAGLGVRHPAPRPHPMSAAALANHPFCRLPPLQSGVIPRAFNPEQALNRNFVPYRANSLLLEVKVSLAKDSLCKADADELVLLVEKLAAHCLQYQKTEVPEKHVHQAANTLAFRFLLLDAIVSGLIATGQRPSADWWRQFVSLIPHDLSHTPQGEQRKDRRQSFYGELARSFSRALETLKSGVRPTAVELFQLKYILFCTQPSLGRFSKPFYNLWREDCIGSGESSQHGAECHHAEESLKTKRQLFICKALAACVIGVFLVLCGASLKREAQAHIYPCTHEDSNVAPSNKLLFLASVHCKPPTRSRAATINSLHVF